MVLVNAKIGPIFAGNVEEGLRLTMEIINAEEEKDLSDRNFTIQC